jgi:bile-acid 7alpha-dehydratase
MIEDTGATVTAAAPARALPDDQHSSTTTEIAAILELKARYMKAINDKEWDAVGDCFAPYASVAYEDGRYSYDGRDQIVEYLRDSLDLIHASHAASNPRVRLLSPTAAEGLWELAFAWHDPWDNTTFHGAGVYTDHYTKTDSGWLISFTGFALTESDS